MGRPKGGTPWNKCFKRGSKTYNDGKFAYVIAENTGSIAIVDIEIEQEIGSFTWFENSKGYFKTNVYDESSKTKQKKLFLHNLIKGKTTKNLVCDHINYNTHDNRLCNLQFISHRLNRTKDTKHKGLYFDKRYLVWTSKIRLPITNESVHLGSFNTETEARDQHNRALAIIEFCTKEDLIALRKQHSRKR
jgi:hypothetical protein